MAQVPEDYPITGLCVVEAVCPSGYIMIDKCHDNKLDADLWRDSGLFSRKTKRYLCITRVFPLDGGRLNNVLVDVNVLDESCAVPPGYTKITVTQDTNEPAFRKKQLVVKMVARNSANDAISDLIFLCKQRKAPQDYTAVSGDMNGLMVCYKVSPVLPTGASQARVSQAPLPYQLNPLQAVNPLGTPYINPYYNPQEQSGAGVRHVQPVQDNHVNRSHPLFGVPFEINSRLRSNTANGTDNIPIKVRSKEDIYNMCNYSFQNERLALQAFNNCQ